MSKKIVRVEVIAEMEVDTDWYPDWCDEGITNKDIKKIESESWLEWIGDNLISEKISVRDI